VTHAPAFRDEQKKEEKMRRKQNWFGSKSLFRVHGCSSATRKWRGTWAAVTLTLTPILLTLTENVTYKQDEQARLGMTAGPGDPAWRWHDPTFNYKEMQ
jgi:hypothetical protein